MLPHISVVQSTGDMDWATLDFILYAQTTCRAHDLIVLPDEGLLRPVLIVVGPTECILESSMPERTAWPIRWSGHDSG